MYIIHFRTTFAYISDCSDQSSRTFRIAFADAALQLGAVAGIVWDVGCVHVIVNERERERRSVRQSQKERERGRERERERERERRRRRERQSDREREREGEGERGRV